MYPIGSMHAAQQHSRVQRFIHLGDRARGSLFLQVVDDSLRCGGTEHTWSAGASSRPTIQTGLECGSSESLPSDAVPGVPGVHLDTSPLGWRCWLAPWTSMERMNSSRQGVFCSWPQTLFAALGRDRAEGSGERGAPSGAQGTSLDPHPAEPGTFHLSLSCQFCLTVLGRIILELTGLHLPLPKVFQDIDGSTSLHPVRLRKTTFA